jgi:hypothetical protein
MFLHTPAPVPAYHRLQRAHEQRQSQCEATTREGFLRREHAFDLALAPFPPAARQDFTSPPRDVPAGEAAHEARDLELARQKSAIYWIRAMLMGEELRSLDGDVFRVDRIAKTLASEGVDRWAKEHKFFEGLDRLRQNLDEIARTDFAGGLANRIDRKSRR